MRRGSGMQPIDKIRTFFCRSQGEEDRITGILSAFLDKIDKKKKGTVIGRKRTIHYDELLERSIFPKYMSSENEVIDHIVELYEGVGLWCHPQTQVNVVPPPTTISIAAAALSARYNENAIWDRYAMSAAQSEVMAIGMLADLIGFDKSTVGGVFTFGGTGCNLYGARIGIEKADPDAKYTGIRDRIHFYTSDISHYSIKSVAIWTGIGLNNVMVIPSDERNVMMISELARAMNETLKRGARIGTIFATMGTTDAFGIDPLREIKELRDKFQEKTDYRIHVHADAVIGWPYLTFKGDEKIRHLPHPLQEEIMSIVSRIAELPYADSIGIDFHKTGWAPYLCSAFVAKDKKDLLLLEKIKKDMPYLYHGDGYQPGAYTLETSRPNYAQKALVNMMLLGKEGYEGLIIHLLTVADYFRMQIERSKEITLLNRYNPAFVTDFRIYPETKYDEDKNSLFERELHDEIEHSFTERINEYNRKISQYMTDRADREGTYDFIH
jgi:L-2,4-diaminobutyrate decarboxylase